MCVPYGRSVRTVRTDGPYGWSVGFWRAGSGPCRREAPPGPLGAPAPPLSRPPPPRPSASLLLSPLSSDQVIRRFSLNELFFEDLSSFELVGTASRSGFSGSVPLPGPVPPVRFSARLLAVPVHRGGFSGFRFGLAAYCNSAVRRIGAKSAGLHPPNLGQFGGTPN